MILLLFYSSGSCVVGSSSGSSSVIRSDNNNNTTINNTSFDLKHATVIIFYLSREGAELVKHKILNECFIDSNSSSNKSSGSSNSGVRIVAIGFNFHSFPVEPSEYFNIH